MSPTDLGLPDLATEDIGGIVLSASDDSLAPKENLIRSDPPLSDPDRRMDGWETRRRREPGHDWCIIRLAAPAIIRQVVVDTAYFRGDYPEACSLEGCDLANDLTEISEAEWVELVPRSLIDGDTKNKFAIERAVRVSHLRFNLHPDGGVARLRVHGEPLPTLVGGEEIDLAGIVAGGRVVSCSDMFFSGPDRLLYPGDPVGSRDGWQTRRRRGPGHDWVVVELAVRGVLSRIVLDTSHFIGNAPTTCWLEGQSGETWEVALPETKVVANSVNEFTTLARRGPYRRVRLSIAPDGGVARLRLYGIPEPVALREAGLRRLNALLPGLARAGLGACCGSSSWVQAMTTARPFESIEHLLEVADTTWRQLDEREKLVAFQAHPQIGERGGGAWPRAEQVGGQASWDEAAMLAELSQRYRERFGYVFVISAAGKRTAEVLAALDSRLANSAETELAIAAAEQEKITHARLLLLTEGLL